MPGREDVVLYVGVPHAGKTTLALAHAAALIRETGYPLLVLDCGHAKKFLTWYHAQSVEEVGDRVWGRGQHTCYFPPNETEFNRVLDGVYGGKRCVLLVDELAFWTTNRSVPESLARLLRGHLQIDVPVLTTTQSVRDLERIARVCVTEAYVFYTDEDGDLEVIGGRWKISKERIFSLGVGQYVKWSRADTFGQPPAPPPPAPAGNS